MKQPAVFLWMIAFLFGCNHKNSLPEIVITTNLGKITAELYPAQAPKTVAAFLSYVDSDLYKDGNFYRVLKTDLEPQYNSGLVQGGIWKTNNAKVLQLPGIPHEPTSQSGLSHTNGTLSLARTTPGSASSEFFICIGDQRQFDKSTSENSDGLGFAAFGKVIQGMDIVRKIQAQPNSEESFIEPIHIISIARN